MSKNDYIHVKLWCFPRLLTAEDFDASSVQVVFGPYDRPHADDQQVTEAGDEGHHPDGHSQHYVRQQVLKRRDAVRVGLTGPDVRRIRTVLELLKVSGREERMRGRTDSDQQKKKDKER